MARKPRPDRDNAASGQQARGGPASMNADSHRGRIPSAEADEAVLRLARLMGRQIAREQFVDRDVPEPPQGRRKKDTP